ncbi:MAG TPA: KH domain-containing protein [Patescibacteria group bacterium]|jgi:hypothetical protein|nr:KH domain-containing protein [Patescibacteria group bacterium]
MKDTLLNIVSAIVDNPDKVEIKEEEVEGVTNFIITVAPEDMGKIIGKGGKVIRAIRSVMKIPAIKQEKRIYITLAEVPQTEAPVAEAPQE